MAQYELMMMLNPQAGQEQLDSSVEAVKTALSEAGATVEKEDVWGEKKLAYKVKGSSKGYYILYTLELDGTKIKDISKLFNLDKTIWRYMFVNLEA
ncbi:30S ribosomal protein S6 [Candidatus Gracilibacteria bacterium]|nr:30S ribosomal protein S6 [Candidatus Gracilibacteria bacterium]